MEKQADELVRQMSEDAKKSAEIPVKQALVEPAPEQSIPDKTEIPVKSSADGDNAKTQNKTDGDRNVESELELWKQRALTLQGKYDAEVPRYASEKRELVEANNSLSAKIEELQGKFRVLEENVNEKKQTEQASLNSSVMDSLEEQLGSESVSNLRKFVSSIIKEEIIKYDKSIQDKVKTVESKIDNGVQRQVLSEKQQYVRDLKLAMPDIYQKNTNPDWKLWLSNAAPFARGKTWQDLLNEANAAYDVEEVVKIFNECPVFKNGNGNGNPKEQPPVEPPKSRPGKPPIEEEKKYYSKKEYDQFYQDSARGKYAGDQKTYQKLDEEFTKAMLEGRIR